MPIHTKKEKAKNKKLSRGQSAARNEKTTGSKSFSAKVKAANKKKKK